MIRRSLYGSGIVIFSDQRVPDLATKHHQIRNQTVGIFLILLQPIGPATLA